MKTQLSTRLSRLFSEIIVKKKTDHRIMILMICISLFEKYQRVIVVLGVLKKRKKEKDSSRKNKWKQYYRWKNLTKITRRRKGYWR